jgi:hypothetical protein
VLAAVREAIDASAVVSDHCSWHAVRIPECAPPASQLRVLPPEPLPPLHEDDSAITNFGAWEAEAAPPARRGPLRSPLAALDAHSTGAIEPTELTRVAGRGCHPTVLRGHTSEPAEVLDGAPAPEAMHVFGIVTEGGGTAAAPQQQQQQQPTLLLLAFGTLPLARLSLSPPAGVFVLPGAPRPRALGLALSPSLDSLLSTALLNAGTAAASLAVSLRQPSPHAGVQ